jgi:MFS family permease
MSGRSGRLLNRDFVLLWQGQLASHLGSQAFLVAVMFWTLETSGSASVMGLFLAVTTLPGVILGPLAGAVADRLSRKAILIVADLVRGVAACGLAALVWWHPGPTASSFTALFVVAVVYGVAGALFNPAISAAIPDLVPAARVQAANSLSQLSGQGSALVGQAAGGVLYRLLGAPLLFAADGVSYLLSAASEAFIRLPRPARAEAEPAGVPLARYLADARDGLAFFWRDRGLRLFLVTAAGINFLFMPVFVLLPFYATEVLGRGAGWYGYLLASLSGGALAGTAAGGVLALRPAARGRLLLAILVVVPALAALLGFAGPVGALGICFALGALTGVLNVSTITLVQLATPPELRGRLMGVLLTLSGAATPLGLAAGGALRDLTAAGVPALYLGLGTLGVILVLAMATRPGLRAFLAREPANAESSATVQ